METLRANGLRRILKLNKVVRMKRSFDYTVKAPFKC